MCDTLWLIVWLCSSDVGQAACPLSPPSLHTAVYSQQLAWEATHSPASACVSIFLVWLLPTNNSQTVSGNCFGCWREEAKWLWATGGERIAEDEVGSGMGRPPLPGVVMTPGAQRCGRLTVKCPWKGKISPEGELRPHCSWLRRSQQVVKAHSWKRKKTEENTRSTWITASAWFMCSLWAEWEHLAGLSSSHGSWSVEMVKDLWGEGSSFTREAPSVQLCLVVRPPGPAWSSVMLKWGHLALLLLWAHLWSLSCCCKNDMDACACVILLCL